MDWEGSKRGKSVLVCGLALCVMEDYEAAKKLRPNAEIILVNYVCKDLVGDYLFTLHLEQVDKMKAIALPENKKIPVLTSEAITNPRCLAFHDKADFIFKDGGFNNATSGYAAARVAADFMGYDEVILCGCPVSDKISGYHPSYYSRKIHYGAGVMRKYMKNLLKYSQEFDHDKIRSMSGYTKELFGGLQ